MLTNHRLGFQRSIKHDMIGDGIDDPPKDFNRKGFSLSDPFFLFFIFYFFSAYKNYMS